MAKLKLQPLGDRVILRRSESEEVTPGGIVLPDSAQEKQCRGVILAVGPGKLQDDGSRSAMQVAKGDTVLFTRYGNESVQVDDEELLIVNEKDLLATVLE